MILDAEFHEENQVLNADFGNIMMVGSGGGNGGASMSYVNQTFANALKGSKKGQVISVDDVSPIEHSLGVKLSSDTIIDFLSVEVSRYGKNFFDMSKIPTSAVLINNGDNSITIKNNYACNTYTPLKTFCPALKVGDVCVLSAEHNSDNNYIILSNAGSWYYGNSKTITQEMLDANVNFYGSREAIDVTIKNIQIEFGTTGNATIFEPYKEPQTVQANADGTVEGLKSISPNMTLLTDTDGAIINLDYNRDINIAFAKLEQAILSNT